MKEEKEKPGRQGILPFSSIRTTMLASYCSTAEHCRAEINEKLQRWGIAYETIARILDQLETCLLYTSRCV